MMLKRFVNMAN